MSHINSDILYIHTVLVSMNDNKTVEVNGLLARHSRSTHVIHLMWISGEEYSLIQV